MRKLSLLFLLIVLFCLNISAQRKTENVILITLDGARLQEIFGGFDVELYKKIQKDADKQELYKKYWSDSNEVEREKLMPFFWQVLMKNHGSIAGNRLLKSEVKTTNNHLFSYPGYSEIVTGEAHDDIIDSNKRIQNKFPSFLQFLQKKMNLNSNQVASFASWNVMNEIVTTDTNAFLVNAGYEEYRTKDAEAQRLSAQQFETPTPWDSVRHDYYTFRFAMSHLKTYHPRVLHIGLGETDDWAHDERYDLYINALHRTDQYFKELWQFLESDKQYKGKTSIIITVDHGRGNNEKDWGGHGKDVPEARYIWMAFISPDVKLRGEWKDAKTLYQNQIAATLCKFLGFDYAEQNPKAGKPINF
ncbi:MAG: phosphoglyceromutase [Acidobacteriota bacterium]